MVESSKESAGQQPENTTIQSDAWPSSLKPTLKSRAHAVLLSIIGSGRFNRDNIEYRALDEQDQAEMKELHSEWFPIEYPPEFFERMHNNNVIAIGCFYKVQVSSTGEDDLPSGDTLVLIGTIFSRVEAENARTEAMLAHCDEPRWNQQTWMERMREFFACGNVILSRRTTCYIMTIGVIDECRKMGLGSQMLDYTIDLLEKKFQQCVAIWLHVIDYNQSAINFYVKNKFIKFRRLKRHYYIENKSYAAILLYKPIGRLRQQNTILAQSKHYKDDESPPQQQAQNANEFVMPDLSSVEDDYSSDERDQNQQ